MEIEYKPLSEYLDYVKGRSEGEDIGAGRIIKMILEPDEITICETVGRLRSLIARSSRVKDAKMGGQDGAASDVMGMKAEYAFAKAFNTFPDLGLKPRSGSPDGFLNGKRYDVKSTHHLDGMLLSTRKVNPDIDVYVLATVKNRCVRFVGWASKEELIKEDNLIDLGYGKGYGLDQNQLKELHPEYGF